MNVTSIQWDKAPRSTGQNWDEVTLFQNSLIQIKAFRACRPDSPSAKEWGQYHIIVLHNFSASPYEAKEQIKCWDLFHFQCLLNNVFERYGVTSEVAHANSEL